MFCPPGEQALNGALVGCDVEPKTDSRGWWWILGMVNGTLWLGGFRNLRKVEPSSVLDVELRHRIEEHPTDGMWELWEEHAELNGQLTLSYVAMRCFP